MGLFQRGVPEADWDELVEGLGGHLLQSRGWAGFQQALGKEVFHNAGNGWCWLGYLEKRRGGQYLYVPYGPTVRGGNAFADAVASLKEAARELGADFVRVEPVGAVQGQDVRAVGGRLVAENQPQRTIVMDLRANVDELRHELAQSNRNLINTAEARGVRIERAQSPDAIGPFLKLLAQTVRHQQIHLYDERYFRQLLERLMPSGQAQLHYAMFGGQHVASAVTLDFANTRYYLFAASDFELNREARAAVPLLWHLIMSAKEVGQEWFDFYGIARTDDPKDKKAGVTRFKLSFCKNVVARVGTWELPIRPAKYHLYRQARRAFRA